MGVVDNAPRYKTIDFHVQYKLHVFHPRTNAHAGTLQLDIKWTGSGLNASPAKGEDYKCTWNWRGAPYGTVGSEFGISAARLGVKASLDLAFPNLQVPRPYSGQRQTMVLINDRWPGPGPVHVLDSRPEHPWFDLIDKIVLRDPNFVPWPQPPQTILKPEDKVAQEWVCKFLTWEKSQRENTIP